MGRRAIGRKAMTNAQRQKRWRKLHKKPKGRSGRLLMDGDYYPTREPKAVNDSLVLWLPTNGFDYVEPCAGAGDLIKILKPHGGNCIKALDTDPKGEGIEQRDALTLTRADIPLGTRIITNPPHSRRSTKLLHKMIVHFSDLAETWLLLPVGRVCNKGRRAYRDRVRRVVPVGSRLQWYDGEGSETRDYVWVCFSRPSKEPAIISL